MATSRIEQLIDDIYEFIESCKITFMSPNKVIVPKDELYDLLDELRIQTPEEIKRYQKMIANRDRIIEDAKKQADSILREAQEKTNTILSEHEIMQQACEQANKLVGETQEEANEIIYRANQDADQIRVGALMYTDDMLNHLQNIIQNAYAEAEAKYSNLMYSLKESLEIVSENRAQLDIPNDMAQQLDPEENLEEAYASSQDISLEQEDM